VKEILGRVTTARTIAEVAADIGVTKGQAKNWLQRLAKEGVLEKLSKPVRYRANAAHGRSL
jgi:predicted ArsR family transcriptional regulator